MKEIQVPEPATAPTLADLIDVPVRHLVKAGFEDLGRMLTIHDELSFEESRALLARFGYDARRARE